jgi:hypothetical protein
MSRPPRIFLETNALKFASERVLRAYRVPKVVRWGSATVTIPMVRWYEKYRRPRLERSQWRLIREISCLPSIAWMAGQGRVELLCTEEVRTELRGLPDTDDPRGLFYGAPITSVKVPAYTSGSGLLERLVLPRGDRRPSGRERQLEFMREVRHQRFLELQRATGAYQGPGRPPHDRQLWDAFHVWSAEYAEADYFLTLDFKLLDHLAHHRSFPPLVTCLAPIALLRHLEKEGAYSWRDWPALLMSGVRQAINPRTDHPLEELVAFSRAQDRAERGPWWRRWGRRQRRLPAFQRLPAEVG